MSFSCGDDEIGFLVVVLAADEGVVVRARCPSDTLYLRGGEKD